MKKYLLSLVTLLLVMTSCQKEDDLLQPIPPNPNTQINTNINVDTTAIVGGDTILVQGI